MPEIIKDSLALNYSQSFDLSGIQEQTVELVLQNAGAATSSIIGNVTAGTDPVPGATVKIFDSTGTPYKHTLTDDKGNYTVADLVAGTYSVAVVKSGYRMSVPISLTLAEADTHTVNISLNADTTLALGAVAGYLFAATKEGKTVALANGKLTLMAAGVTIATTYSAADGEFAFYDVADGSYTIVAVSDGYILPAPVAITISKGSIINVNLTLNIDSQTYHGTVNGVIKNAIGGTVAGCFVGLYQVVTNPDTTTTTTLVAVTKTNANGQYLFGQVDAGKYVVKAKLNG